MFLSILLAYVFSGLGILGTLTVDRHMLITVPMPIKLNGIIEYVILLLIIASIAEELLFRGFFEGYKLNANVAPLMAISLNAVFCPITCIGDKGSSFGITVVLALAFGVGLVAGYYRWITGSILPLIVIHSTANLGEVVYYYESGT